MSRAEVRLFLSLSRCLISKLTVASLAYAELYLTLARIVRLVDMKLVGTTIEKIQVGRDLGHPAPKDGSFEVKAEIVGVTAYP